MLLFVLILISPGAKEYSVLLIVLMKRAGVRTVLEHPFVAYIPSVGVHAHEMTKFRSARKSLFLKSSAGCPPGV